MIFIRVGTGKTTPQPDFRRTQAGIFEVLSSLGPAMRFVIGLLCVARLTHINDCTCICSYCFFYAYSVLHYTYVLMLVVLGLCRSRRLLLV